jgi:hypothetical protein
MRLVHRDGAEPSLPEVAGAFAPCVDHAGVPPMHAPGRATQAVFALGGENEMDLRRVRNISTFSPRKSAAPCRAGRRECEGNGPRRASIGRKANLGSEQLRKVGWDSRDVSCPPSGCAPKFGRRSDPGFKLIGGAGAEPLFYRNRYLEELGVERSREDDPPHWTSARGASPRSPFFQTLEKGIVRDQAFAGVDFGLRPGDLFLSLGAERIGQHFLVFVVDGQNERRLRRGRTHEASYHARWWRQRARTRVYRHASLSPTGSDPANLASSRST